jgi:hypothetical protein
MWAIFYGAGMKPRCEILPVFLSGREFRAEEIKDIQETVVRQFAVAALCERRNSLRNQDRRAETALTKIKLTLYPADAAGGLEVEQ